MRVVILLILLTIPSCPSNERRISFYDCGRVTADGTIIDESAVANGTQRIAAVSQHLRGEYPYGSWIWVEGLGVYVVHDCTASYIMNTIDIRVPKGKAKGLYKRKVYKIGSY